MSIMGLDIGQYCPISNNVNLREPTLPFNLPEFNAQASDIYRYIRSYGHARLAGSAQGMPKCFTIISSIDLHIMIQFMCLWQVCVCVGGVKII